MKITFNRLGSRFFATRLFVVKSSAVKLGAVVLGLLLPWLAQAGECPAFFEGELKKLHSEETINLCDDWQGQPTLIVNTASFCGFTPQFEALEAVHQRYSGKGLRVLGFPSDDFRQEADSESETAEICYINYGVSFTMLAPVSVKGSKAHPIFKELARQTRAPSWNFNKYLINGEGKVTARFGSRVSPESKKFLAALDELVAQ